MGENVIISVFAVSREPLDIEQYFKLRLYTTLALQVFHATHLNRFTVAGGDPLPIYSMFVYKVDSTHVLQP